MRSFLSTRVICILILIWVFIFTFTCCTICAQLPYLFFVVKEFTNFLWDFKVKSWKMLDRKKILSIVYRRVAARKFLCCVSLEAMAITFGYLFLLVSGLLLSMTLFLLFEFAEKMYWHKLWLSGKRSSCFESIWD